MAQLHETELVAISDALQFVHSNHLGNEISEFKERVAICNRLKAMIYAGDLNFNKDDIDHLCCALRFFIDNSHTLTVEHLHVMRKLHNLKTETAV